jgi:multicomponent Na+:H+ antiporter subunit A
MLIALAVILVLSLAGPWLNRLAPSLIGWILAIPLGAVAGFFCSYIPAVSAGEVFREQYVWAPPLGIALSFRLDGLSLLFALLITAIGVLVTIYAGAYLKGRSTLGVFYIWLLLFMASMLGMALADNLIVLFVFWELTTITSYLLIGFEHERASARSAALQALLVTASGGLALLAGLLLLGHVGGTYELSILMTRGEAIRSHPFYLPILALVLIGAFTKSAQFPFHFWLPAAMEAPTPVSAYLHSATMVKAGVYLLARFLPLLGGTVEWTLVVAPIGAITMVLGAWLAIFARDLKQILAYSTVSMLGTLTMLLGMGNEPAVAAAMAMLLAHALYKGALFLVAGTVDHETGTRNIEQLGGLRRVMPITALAAGLAAISMSGVLPTVGFIAKEAAYEALQEPETPLAAIGALMFASALTVAAAGLIFVRPFFGSRTSQAAAAHEAPIGLWLGPVLLASAGLAFGLAPAALAQPLLGASIEAATGVPTQAKFVLWHGFTWVFALSIATLAAGVLIYAALGLLRRGLEAPTRFVSWIGPAVYEAGLGGLNFIAKWQTRMLQNGYLRFYVITLIVASFGLLGVALARAIPLYELPDSSSVRIYEVIVAGLIVVSALLTIVLSSRLAAVASLGVVGYAVAVVYVIYGAPDLAMTQFVIETLTVILLVLVLYHLPRFQSRSTVPARVRDAALAIMAGGVISVLLLFAINVRTHGAVSDYYVENALPGGHGRNIVNVILVDFRALDTLGEITVLGIAGVGVYALLKLRSPAREEENA